MKAHLRLHKTNIIYSLFAFFSFNFFFLTEGKLGFIKWFYEVMYEVVWETFTSLLCVFFLNRKVFNYNEWVYILNKWDFLWNISFWRYIIGSLSTAVIKTFNVTFTSRGKAVESSKTDLVANDQKIDIVNF